MELTKISASPTADAIVKPARIAVIVPAYGVAHLLGEALDSVLAQTYANWECIVIDDGAPDDVAGAVAPYLQDKRFHFLETSNGGVACARNRAIAASTAPFICLLDGDDILRPDYLADMVAALEADPEAKIVTCNARLFGSVAAPDHVVDSKQGTSDGVHGSLADVLDRTFNVYIGSAFRRSDFENTSGFDTDMTHCEDLDFWVQLMMLGSHATYVDKVLGEYRVRASSASANAQSMLKGNIYVYEKAKSILGDCSSGKVAQALSLKNHRQLDYEIALEQVIAGQCKKGLAQLRATSPDKLRPHWRLAFMVWNFLPQLAPPILRWRQNAHMRGGSGKEIQSLQQMNKAHKQ